MSKRTLFLIFALFIITLVLFVVAVYKPSSNPSPETQTIVPTHEPVAQTSLMFGSLSTSVSSVSSKINYSLPINITTEKNKVTAVQLELQYDPEVLTSVSVVPGIFFENPVILLNKIDIKEGRISYAFGINPTENGISGENTVAILTFQAIPEIQTQTTISFLPKTLVTAEGINQSVLKQTFPIQFTVGEQ